MTGFRSIIYQHCINHINGKLLINEELSKGKFQIAKEYVQYFPKAKFILSEYSLRVKMYL